MDVVNQVNTQHALELLIVLFVLMYFQVPSLALAEVLFPAYNEVSLIISK